MSAQPGILEPVPAFSRYLFFQLAHGADPSEALARLASRAIGRELVIGLGPALVARAGGDVAGLRELPVLSGPGVSSPSTPFALFAWLRSDEPGAFLPLARALEAELSPALELALTIDGFRYDGGRDLSGYVDGTENPEGDEAIDAAIAHGVGPGVDGGSFVAVQQWVHRLDRFFAMRPEERDLVIGRRASDDEELDDAPPSAHVKRTAQESFEPEAFVLRRSMPFSEGGREGLVFVAFGSSLDAFEAQLRRMLGLEDGIADALFRFTRPVTGSAFFCPPLEDGRLDLRAARR